jgi:tetratricopeptide (TPR) repeat protein
VGTKLAASCALAAALAFASLAAGCASKPPALAQEWYDIGNVWFDKQDWKKAGEAYTRVLKIDGNFPGASFNLARCLASTGDYEGSLKELERLLKRDPGNVRVVSARAYALYKLGNAKAALIAYHEVLDKDPYAPDAVFNAALLELAIGDATSAATHLEQLSLASPDDGQILIALGNARDKTGDPNGAMESFERARVLGKADAATFERLGELYELGRRFKDAMDAYDSAVKAEAGRAKSWFALARLKLVVASDSERGLEALKRALESGFHDGDAAAALMDEPDLVAREKVLDLLKGKGLIE